MHSHRALCVSMGMLKLDTVANAGAVSDECDVEVTYITCKDLQAPL